MKNKAVYPGTFDPMTLGHEDLVRRAARLFDHVVLAVADSRTKRPLFTLAERIDMARDALADVKNVSVEGFSGLLMNFVQEHDARVVMRGVRAVSDFDYEFQLAGMNRKLYPEVETVFMTPGEEHMFLSATLVREISVMGGDVSKFVSPTVAAATLMARGASTGGWESVRGACGVPVSAAARASGTNRLAMFTSSPFAVTFACSVDSKTRTPSSACCQTVVRSPLWGVT